MWRWKRKGVLIKRREGPEGAVKEDRQLGCKGGEVGGDGGRDEEDKEVKEQEEKEEEIKV